MNKAHDLWIAAVLETFNSQKQMVEHAVGQIDDAALRRRPAESFNSIEVIMRHMAGNMLSRWTDFLSSDGEKPGRDRDSEFTDWTGTRDELLAFWQRGWKALFDAIEPLTQADALRTVYIRAQPLSVPGAMERQIAHYGYHTGQILLLARLFADPGRWRWLTIPPKGSQAYNQQLGHRQ